MPPLHPAGSTEVGLEEEEEEEVGVEWSGVELPVPLPPPLSPLCVPPQLTGTPHFKKVQIGLVIIKTCSHNTCNFFCTATRKIQNNKSNLYFFNVGGRMMKFTYLPESAVIKL